MSYFILCFYWLIEFVLMDTEMRIILRNNVIKFIIGVILLSISFVYIQDHPAEKASIFSGFEVLVQRVEIFLYKITNKDSEWLKVKFDYEKNFEELLTTAKNNSCVKANVVDELNEVLLALKKERLAELESNLWHYKRKFSEYKSMIDSACKK